MLRQWLGLSNVFAGPHLTSIPKPSDAKELFSKGIHATCGFEIAMNGVVYEWDGLKENGKKGGTFQWLNLWKWRTLRRVPVTVKANAN